MCACHSTVLSNRPSSCPWVCVSCPWVCAEMKVLLPLTDPRTRQDVTAETGERLIGENDRVKTGWASTARVSGRLRGARRAGLRKPVRRLLGGTM